MPKAHSEWTVLRHDPIEKLEENLWCVTGTLPGMALKRVMTLVRLDDGRVIVHSAVALDEDSCRRSRPGDDPPFCWCQTPTTASTRPRSRLDTRTCRCYCPRGGRAKIEGVVAIDGTLR